MQKKSLTLVLVALTSFVACGGTNNGRPPETPPASPTTGGSETVTTSANAPSTTSTSTSTSAPSIAPPYDPEAASTSTMPEGTSATTRPPSTNPMPPTRIPPPSADTSNANNANIDRVNSGAAGDGKVNNSNAHDKNNAQTPTPTPGAPPTAMDQGTSDAERKITADIRKHLVADGALTFLAKNVTIITIGSKVTLRGAVNSAREKAIIERYAKGQPGVTDVDDQLEVKK